MAGRGDPPEGPAEGLPGGDDEYRSVVFDESFIRAARLQEFSAQERLGDEAHTAVRTVQPRRIGRGPRRFLALLMLVVLAFCTAIYLGVRNPYRPPGSRAADRPRLSLVPLAPAGRVPGGTPDDLFEHSPAARFRSGAAGITLPPARSTPHFSEGQVTAALITAKDYLVASSLDPDVLMGREVRPVRMLLAPGQLEQFDESFADPSDDARSVPAGWLVSFDPAKVAPAETAARVQGTLHYRETGPGTLEVMSDHTFVYALRPAGSEATPARHASLFSVRREMHFRFDHEDLGMHRAELLLSEVQAGPQSCSAEAPKTLSPLLAGQQATGDRPAVTNPYTRGQAPSAVCGALDPAAEPSPTGAGR